MEKIIWYWNMVYYFCMKCDNKMGDIITYPLYKLFNTNLLRKWSQKRREIEYDDSILKNAIIQSQINDIYIETLLKGALACPICGLWIILQTILKVFFDINVSKDLAIGIFIALLLIVCFPISNYLFGKNDRYLKYFKEFDKKFKKCSKATKYIYGILSILFVLFLASTFLLSMIISDMIKGVW